jgi:hypothetical protein
MRIFYWIVIALWGLLTLACSSRQASKSPEVFLFAEVGPAPFTDSIVSVDMRGSRKYILSSERQRSFLFISAISMSKPVIVAVHGIGETGKVEDHLQSGMLGQNEWKRLVHIQGYEGEAALNPDGRRFVFSLAPKDKPGRPHLWFAAMNDSPPAPITNDSDPTVWESSPSWSPNGQELLFIQHRIGVAGPESVLIKFDASSKATSTMLTLREPLAAVTYLKDAGCIAFLSRSGLEIMRLQDGRRKILFSWSELAGYGYGGGGITAARFDTVVALPLYNQKKKQYELVLFDYEKQSKKSIYSTRNPVLGLSFVPST